MFNKLSRLKDDIEFVDLTWQPYPILKNDEDMLRRQIHHTIGSGLKEQNDGIEYAFVPTVRMKNLEERIIAEYDKLKVVDNTVAICNEVYFTSTIEGANTTLLRTQQIYNGEYVDASNYFSEKMLTGGFELTKFLNIHGNRIDKNILIRAWKILTDGCRDNEDIMGEEYRTGNVQVGSHVGLNYMLVPEAMDLWIQYYNSEVLSMHPFIKSTLLHYAFEFIHPFCDGNGRMGRALMTNFLIKEGFDKLKAVSVSHSIEKNRNDYYTAFAISDNVYSDCTYFIEYMLSMFLDAIIDARDGKLSIQ